MNSRHLSKLIPIDTATRIGLVWIVILKIAVMEIFKNFSVFLFGIMCILVIPSTECKHMYDYGSSCDNDDYTCDRSKRLICLDGKCNCTSPETMFLNETSGECLTKLFSSCIQEEFNTKNINRFEKFVGSQTVKFKRKLPCGSGAICDERTLHMCACPNPEDKGTNESCTLPPQAATSTTTATPVRNKQKFGTKIKCNFGNRENRTCPTGLRCVDGVCQCSVLDQQYFNGTECLSMVNGPCGGGVALEAQTNVWKCTPFAKCISVGVDSICQCEEGYTASGNGRCIPGYGQVCNLSKEQRCKEDALLHCVDGICQCQDALQIFDTNTKHCRGLVGATCQYDHFYNALNPRFSILQSPQFCIEGAYCDAVKQIYETSNGVCKCSSEFSETTNRTCV